MRIVDDHRPRQRPREATEIPLPPERAFVVQLRPLRDPTAELLVGRIEHVASGTTCRFRSADELTAFIAKIGRDGISSSPARTRPEDGEEGERK